MIKSTSHETWAKISLKAFLRDNEASFILSCSNFNFQSFLSLRAAVSSNNPQELAVKNGPIALWTEF